MVDHHTHCLLFFLHLPTVVATDWLPTLPYPAASAFHAWFAAAPAPLVLDAACRHLASVAPLSSLHAGGAVAAPLGADATASVAAARFVEGDGVAQLAAHCAVADHGDGGSGGSECRWRRRVPCGPSPLAAALASLPDRAAAVGLAALAPTAFTAAVAGAVVRAAAGGGDGASAFAGALLTRLARRGWADAAAAGAWGCGAPLTRPLAASPADGGDPACACAALLAGLLAAAAGTHPDAATAGAALATSLDAPTTLAHQGAVAAADALLTARPLAPRAAAVLPHLLAAAGGLDAALARAAAAWAPDVAATSTPAPLAAYTSAALAACVATAGASRLDATPGLVPLLLRGVGARLGQPLDPARRAGMRVGAVLASVLGGGGGGGGDAPAPATPLFTGADLSLLPEEYWHPACTPDAWLLGRPPPPGVGVAEPPRAAPTPSAAPLSLDEDAAPPSLPRDTPTTTIDWSVPPSGAASEADPERDDLTTPAGGGPTASARAAGIGRSLMPRPAQVRDVVAALRKSGDPGGVAAAARAAATLVAAPPDELLSATAPDAPDLARALLTARVPEWADEEAAAVGGDPPSAAARRALVGVTTLAPGRVGAALAESLYSPHLDLGQRYLVLDTLTEAARQLAAGGPALGGVDETQSLRVTSPTPPPPLTIAPAVRQSRTRVWAPASLAAGREPAPPPPPRNAFITHALPWATALLARCDVESHGMDLFGRDTALLGRLLTTLAALAAAAAPAREGALVAAALLQLALSPAVADSPAPYVRRCALAATAAAAASLRPAAVEGDDGLARSLRSARAWAARVAAADTDPGCRSLAIAAEAAHAVVGVDAALADLGGGGGPRGDAVGRLARVVVPGAGVLM